jgi:arylsulfatase A-like enzyme
VHTPVHGAIENGIRRRTDLPVFPDVLNELGYTNIMVGKTHFAPVPDSFHVQRLTYGEKGSDVDDFYAEHIRAHGHSRSSAHPNPIPPELFMDAFLADTTIGEIKNVVEKGGAPFFAFCSMPSPHSPNDPPGDWAHLFDGVRLPELNYVEGEIERHPVSLRTLLGTLPDSVRHSSGYADGPFQRIREAMGNTVEPDLRGLIEDYRRLYYGLAAYCDAQVGRILDYLDQSGLREDTLVIFSSDHGLQLFDHGFNDKHNYYDESWRVPLILSQPGTLPEGEQQRFAIWNDITATILGAAGASQDWVQGFDLYHPLKEGGGSPRHNAVATLYRSVAVATERWKLEYYLEEATGRLFDRRADPQEQNDLYGDGNHREIRDGFLQALLTWRASLLDVAWLKGHTHGAGPVAKNVATVTHAMTARDAELRLQEQLAEIDPVG